MKIKNAKCCALCVWFGDCLGGAHNSVIGSCSRLEDECYKVWGHQTCEDFELYDGYKKEFEIKDI
ncbi:hypothetical protein [Cetobacterium sp.]|uniref:hypothetical protein n=1 Tax=Cetobacterium sp. TaxID=2071632 RepID=UPI003EE50762